MPWWAWWLVAMAVAASLIGLAVAAGVLLYLRSKGVKAGLVRRVLSLPARNKLRLLRRLLGDRRLPLWGRALLPLLALYLVLPVDIVPDFIPVLGYVDDLLLAALVVVLLLRSVPPALVQEHLAALESEERERRARDRP